MSQKTQLDLRALEKLDSAQLDALILKTYDAISPEGKAIMVRELNARLPDQTTKA